MAETIRLHVEVGGYGIIVTLPGTTLRVFFRKPHEASGLVAFDGPLSSVRTIGSHHWEAQLMDRASFLIGEPDCLAVRWPTWR
jgi:hypothetical protein